MTTPYSRLISVPACPSGEHTCAVLPAPARGIVARVVVKQVSGVAAGFSYDLFDRADACGSGVSESATPEVSSVPDDLMWLGDPDLHKIQASQSVTGPTVINEQYGLQLPYINQDEQPAYTGMPGTAIYIDIVPDGTGEKDFLVSYTITVDIVG